MKKPINHEYLILTEWRVQIKRRTDSREELHITTWVRGKAPASTMSLT